MTSPAGAVFLIVNADDFNLTEGVSEGILEAHDRGIVTSTSFMVNLPAPAHIVKELNKRKRLGVGLHLNITLGMPVSPARKVPTLVDANGVFRKRAKLDFRRLSGEELALEYRSQIEKFKKLLGRLPTHLDTHHHLHAEKKIFAVLNQVAAGYRLPIRISGICFPGARKRLKAKGIPTTDTLIEDLEPQKAWNTGSLTKILAGLKPGIHELMCHPARCDKSLMNISSFNRTREQELKALCSPLTLAVLKKRGVRLISFADL